MTNFTNTALSYEFDQPPEPKPLPDITKLCDIIADIDRKYEPLKDIKWVSDKFYSLLNERRFLPESSILNAPVNQPSLLLKNTTLSLSDDLDDLFHALKRTSILLQNQIQVFLDFSHLRASRTSSNAGLKQVAGLLRFMELFERAPQNLETPTKQKFFFNVDHVEIHDALDFIKSHSGHIDFCLGITDAFIFSLKSKTKFFLKHHSFAEPSTSTDVIKLFHKIVNLIRDGINLDLVFSNRLSAFKHHHAINHDFILNTQNQLIKPSGFSAQGAINLKPLLNSEGINEKLLKATTEQAIHFLDNCFDQNFFVDSHSKDISLRNRHLGISLFGIHDYISLMNPEGGMQKTKYLLKQLASLMNKHLVLASHDLGKKRGFKSQMSLDGDLIKTRHSQLLTQLNVSDLSCYMTAPEYLLKHNMTDKDYESLFPWHMTWQNNLNNIACFKQPVSKSIDLDKFVKLFFLSHELGFLTFES